MTGRGDRMREPSSSTTATNVPEVRDPRRRRSGWKRWVIGPIAAIAVGVAVATVTYQTSLQPGEALVKAAFEARPLVHPGAEFAAAESRVRPVVRAALDGADAPSSSIDIYRPVQSNAEALPMILWIHGGGFIASSSSTIADYAIRLASAGYVVAALDYTLAPGAHHPIPVRQASTALVYLQAHAGEWGGDGSRILIGGDSAGAQIASETAAAQTAPALASSDGVVDVLEPQTLRGVILFCGLYDMDTVAGTGFPALRTYLWAYTGHRDWRTYPRIENLSTTRQVTAEYPPTFISVGDLDPFRTQAAELASVLAAADIPLTTLFWDGTGAGLGHEYQFDLTLPHAQEAFARTLAFIASAVGS